MTIKTDWPEELGEIPDIKLDFGATIQPNCDVRALAIDIYRSEWRDYISETGELPSEAESTVRLGLGVEFDAQTKTWREASRVFRETNPAFSSLIDDAIENARNDWVRDMMYRVLNTMELMVYNGELGDEDEEPEVVERKERADTSWKPGSVPPPSRKHVLAYGKAMCDRDDEDVPDHFLIAWCTDTPIWYSTEAVTDVKFWMEIPELPRERA